MRIYEAPNPHSPHPQKTDLMLNFAEILPENPYNHPNAELQTMNKS